MCDTIVVVERGRVLFAKNSDRDPNEAQALSWHPRARHPKGSKVRCTHVEIDQVEETHAVLLSRPFWIWGAEMGCNEHGVVIGNEAVFSMSGVPEKGLLGMDLLRLSLERASSASEAVDVLLWLLEAYGQGGAAGLEHGWFRYDNSFLIADAHGAFVVETVGRAHATERVSGVRSISNGLTIPGFAERHRDPVRTAIACADARRGRTAELAARDATPRGLAAALRDHGEGRRWPAYSPVNGCMDAPCTHGGGLVAATQTVGSWVSELSPGRVRHWATGTAAPCVSLFKPVRVDAPIDTGPWPSERDDGASLFWRGERVHRAVLADPDEGAALVLPERDLLERAMFDGDVDPVQAFAQGDRHIEASTRALSALTPRDTRPLVARRYWATRERWARS